MKEYNMVYFPSENITYENSKNAEYFFITLNTIQSEINKEYEKIESVISIKSQEIEKLSMQLLKKEEMIEDTKKQLMEIRVKAEIENNSDIQRIVEKNKNNIKKQQSDIEEIIEEIKTKEIVIDQLKNKLLTINKSNNKHTLKKCFDNLMSANSKLETDVRNVMKSIAKAFTEYETYQNLVRREYGRDTVQRSYFSEISALNNLLNGVIVATSYNSNFYE